MSWWSKTLHDEMKLFMKTFSSEIIILLLSFCLFLKYWMVSWIEVGVFYLTQNSVQETCIDFVDLFTL